MLLMCCCLPNKVTPEQGLDRTNNNLKSNVINKVPARSWWQWNCRVLPETPYVKENVFHESRNNSGERENDILHKPILARQNKFMPPVPKEDEKIQAAELQPERRMSAAFSDQSLQVLATSEIKEEKEEVDRIPSDITPTPSLFQIEKKDIADVEESLILDSYPDLMNDATEEKDEVCRDSSSSVGCVNTGISTLEEEKSEGDGKEDVQIFEENQEPEGEEKRAVTPVIVEDVPEQRDKTPSISPKKSESTVICKPRLKLRRPTIKDQKTGTTSSIYPDTMPPFEHPKEAVTKCLLQLENPEWEVTMQGLQGIVRLSRHHASVLTPALHPVAVTITKHIRNLRSQVSRAACQATAQLFKSFGRILEGEVDELAGALFNRTADTNKFLRADCNAALDTLIENISAVKSINAIVNRGVKHQNAVVRTSACRLLLKLTERLGPERTLSLPRDTRDVLLISSARFLMEGSLDTRRYAKEIFANLALDNRLPSIMTEVVPSSIMRNINKVLTRLGAK